MRTGIWTQFLNGLPLEEAIRVFAEKGWTRLELSSEHGFRLLERGDPADAGRDFRRFAEALGVSFPQGHLWLTCDIAAGDRAETISRLKRWLDLFLALGIRAAVLHPGGDELREQGATPEAILETQVRALRELAGHVRGADLTICLENMANQTADDLCAIIEAVGGDGLGICLDTGHLNLISKDQAGFIHKAGRLLKALHIADNEGSHDQHLMPYARGTVPWGEVVSALRAVGYDGLFNFEVPGENRCPIPVRLAKLDYLKAVLPLLLDGVE